MENSMITTKIIQRKKKVKSKTGFGMTCPTNNNKPKAKSKLPSVYLSTIHRILDTCRLKKAFCANLETA